MKKYFFPHDHTKTHLKHLDGFRGIAVLIVLIAHGSEVGLNLHPILNFTYTGKIGVYAFFILSAYLLDQQIVKAFRQRKSDAWYWGNYILRRFLRIFPLLILSLFFYYTLNRKYKGTPIQDQKDIINHILLTEGEIMYWSIPVEFKYYLISPIIILICYSMFKWNLKKSVIFISTLAIGSLVLSAIIGFSTISTTRYLSIFLIGTLLVLVEEFKPDMLKFHFTYLAGVSCVLLVLSVPHYLKLMIGWHWWIASPGTSFIYGLLVAIIFLAVHYNKGVFYRICRWRFIRFLGVISYSLYLFHFGFALLLGKYHIGPVWFTTLLYFFISILFSSVSYLIIEYPLSKIRFKRFQNEKINLHPANTISTTKKRKI